MYISHFLRSILVLAFSAVFLLGCSEPTKPSESSQSHNQSIIHGGTIYTANPNKPYVEAVGIQDDKIIAVGSYKEVKAALNKDAKSIDLNNAYLMPGMIDTHIHAAFAGFQEQTVNLPNGLKSAEDFHEFMESVAQDDRLKIGDVLYLSNVNIEEYWNQLPLLNEVFNSDKYDGIPVVLAGYDAHTGWANRAMLEKAEIDADNPDALDTSVKDNFGVGQDGKLNGYTSEGAWDVILGALPPVSEEVIESSIITAAKQLNEFGITAWMDPISNIRPAAPVFSAHPDRSSEGLLPAYTHLSKKGKLTGHVSALALVGINSEPDIIDDVVWLRERFASAPDVELKGIKILQDGVIEPPSESAKLSEPYLNREGYTGKTDLNMERYKKMLAKADENGLLIHIHAIGDRAATEALDALEFVRKTNKNDATLHSITHLQVVDEKDIPRLKALNVGASMQMLWASGGSAEFLRDTVPNHLLERMYPAGSLLKHGTLLAGASDWPVSTANPFLAIYTAVTRKGADGRVLPPSEEAVDRLQMLEAYTINAARVIGREDEIGSIEVGKSADFAVLDRNIEKVDMEDFKETQLLWTMFKGNVVYVQ